MTIDRMTAKASSSTGVLSPGRRCTPLGQGRICRAGHFPAFGKPSHNILRAEGRNSAATSWARQALRMAWKACSTSGELMSTPGYWWRRPSGRCRAPALRTTAPVPGRREQSVPPIHRRTLSETTSQDRLTDRFRFCGRHRHRDKMLLSVGASGAGPGIAISPCLPKTTISIVSCSVLIT